MAAPLKPTPWRHGALALPLALATAATAGVRADTGSGRHAQDRWSDAGLRPAMLQPPEAAADGEPLRGTSAYGSAWRHLEAGLQRQVAAGWPPQPQATGHPQPAAAAGPAGPGPHEPWPVLALAALLLLHQREATDRMRHRHIQTLRAQRERLQAEVSRCTRDLGEMARHLHTLHEDESRRLARDLHDELGALLTVAKLNTAQLRRRMEPAGEDVRQRLEQLDSALNEGMRLKQRIIENLVPSSLTHLGLAPALEIQAREFARHTDLQVQADLEPLRLAHNAEITAYRLVQECLTNIARHAQARRVHIVLDTLQTRAGPCARLRVSDDGRGFEVAGARCSGHGLLGMRYRVEAAGGTWRVRSSPGHGTRVEAHLPLHATCQDACAEPH